MPRYLVPDFEHPRRLPGEPVRESPPASRFALRLLLRVLLIGLASAVVLPLWVPFLIGIAIWGYPPNVVRPPQAFYYLGLIWHRRPASPGLSRLQMLWLSISVVRGAAFAPLGGLAWQLDLLLYGRRLRAVEIRAPIIKISAARSGSTQLAHYIEADPRVVSPNVLQMLMPYLWLWRLVVPTIGRVVDRARVDAWLHRQLPPEFVERHEIDAFATDTLEVVLYGRHLNRFAPFLGADVMVEEFSLAVTTPTTERLWRRVFVDLFDGIARKTLFFADAGPEQRLFVKGHFLAAADALAERYPDGRFLTMLRQPSKRLQSMCNFLWCNPTEAPLGKPPWGQLVEGLARIELGYNTRELQWFTAEQGPRRTVLRFADYVRDLEGTLRTVYAECFDTQTLPPSAPTRHAPRERRNYSVNRSLAQLGVDGAAYDAAQPGFIAWCCGQGAVDSAPAVAQSTAETGASA